MTGRVLQAQRPFLEATVAQEVVDLTRVATTRGETNADENSRGASSPPQKYDHHVGYAVNMTCMTGSPSPAGPSAQ